MERTDAGANDQEAHYDCDYIDGGRLEPLVKDDGGDYMKEVKVSLGRVAFAVDGNGPSVAPVNITYCGRTVQHGCEASEMGRRTYVGRRNHRRVEEGQGLVKL